MVRQGKTQVHTLAPNLRTVWTWTILRLSFLTYKLMAEVVFFKSWREVLTVSPSGGSYLTTGPVVSSLHECILKGAAPPSS